MSRGERRKDKRAESPMQKQDVVVRASRLLVWDRSPRSCPCGTGALAGHSATCGPGRYPGPHLRNLRLGHNSPLQRQRREACRPFQRQRRDTYQPLQRQRRDTYQPLQRQRRDTYQPWLKAKETGPPKILTGLKARNITSRCRSIPNMFRAFSPLACFESQPLALQARLVCIAPSALKRGNPNLRARIPPFARKRGKPWPACTFHASAPTARNIPPTIRCLLVSANGASHTSLG